MREIPGGSSQAVDAISCVEVTPERWTDLESLFGEAGACGGCWCMYWRLAAKDWGAGKGEGNRQALEALVRAGPPPGLLAYRGATPVGWCAVAPRAAFPRLDRSKNLAPVDDLPVWSLACFFVARRHRRTGVSEHLIRGAVAMARSHGAIALEAYPVVPQEAEMPDAFAWTGILSSFRKLGFQEVARRSVNRPIVRLELGTSVVK